MFAGNCTSEVHFYDSPNQHNYKRAVTWAVVMAFLSHSHPAFQSVFSIEAINEPLADAKKTPGLGDCEPFVIPNRGKGDQVDRIYFVRLRRIRTRHPRNRILPRHI